MTPGTLLTVYSYLSTANQIAEWLLHIGYCAEIAIENGSSLTKKICDANDDAIRGIFLDRSQRSWRLIRQSRLKENSICTILLIGNIHGPLSDILRSTYSTSRMNLITHRNAYALFPKSALNVASTFSTQPGNIHLPYYGLRQYVRWLMDTDAVSGTQLLPSAGEALASTGPYSFLCYRSFTDKFSRVLQIYPNDPLSIDDVDLNAFQLSYGPNWLSINFTTLQDPHDCFRYCLPSDVAKTMYRKSFLTVPGLRSEQKFRDILHNEILRPRTPESSSFSFKTSLTVGVILRQCGAMSSIAEAKMPLLDAYSVEVLFQMIHCIHKEVLNIYLKKRCRPPAQRGRDAISVWWASLKADTIQALMFIKAQFCLACMALIAILGDE
ncbi:hypothetical protein GYMLUDRAFT_235892 [Collybiopsis luxurians FD-317 M1]|nr:hypothetical protein GYMLUDRAFT_235892 [Collybiopsis luxurians FD-317 M1]